MSKKEPKMSRRERERRMIAEMDAAMWGQRNSSESAEDSTDKANGEKKGKVCVQPQKSAGQQLHCPRCKTLMENGKCPTCGHYIYVPMDKEKRNKIRWIVGGICMVGFAILFILLQAKK